MYLIQLHLISYNKGMIDHTTQDSKAYIRLALIVSSIRG